MDLFVFAIFMGATLLARAMGYALESRQAVPESEEQADLLGAEIVRLQPRAQAAERDETQSKVRAGRKLPGLRIQR